MGKFQIAQVLLCVLTIASAITRPSSIKFENNEYTGLVVGIHPDIPENEELLNEIQRMITDASDYLYTASKTRAHFKDVTIVLPDTWSDSDLYETPGNATFEFADVIVAPSNPRYAPIPYTKHFEGCGKQAAYIHFTDAFLLDDLSELYYGPLGPLFVHEWGHFRWGLLNEYADTVADRNSYQYHYRSPTTGIYEATRCTLGLNGAHLKLDENTLRYTYCNGGPTLGYEEGCIFIPTSDQDPSAVSGSIMFGYTSLPEIADFCDNNTADGSTFHNIEAPNKLNRICGSRSSWEIMREHPDFKDGANPPRIVIDREPTFHITRVLSRRVVVVMDTSISMLNDGRHYKQASAVAHFLSSVVLDGTWVGLVSFATESKTESELVLVNSSAVRNDLLASIPQEQPFGGTCIQCGLTEAIQLLQTSGQRTDGAVILLITDGDETVGDVSEALSDATTAKVVVDAVAFSEEADKQLASVSSQTGGSLYLQTDDPGSSGLYQGLSGTMKRGVKETEQRIELESTSSVIEVEGTLNGQVSVDNSIGERTSFYFTWIKNTGNVLIDVILRSPSGTVYDQSSPEYTENTEFRNVIINVPGTAEEGNWTYSVDNLYTKEMEVAVVIGSYPKQDGDGPITVTSYLSGSSLDAQNGEQLTVFAEVRKGYSPVVDANVVAILERPPDGEGNVFTPVELQLLDNGAGADLTDGDGIYSRYFTEYSSTGFYGVKLRVDNNDGNAVILRQTNYEVPFEAAQLVIDPDDLNNVIPPVIGGVRARLPGMLPPELEGDPAPDFSREGTGQSASVADLPEGYDPNVDSTPPSTILDLRVTQTSYEEATVTLVWTAPGDDLDSGQAESYDIRRADTVQELLESFDSATVVEPDDVSDGSLPSPLVFGMTQTVTISVPPQPNQNSFSYAFAIKSVDDVGLSSEMSNVVVATFENYVIPTSRPETTTSESFTPTPDPVSLEAWKVVLIVVGCLVFILLLYLLFACIKKQRESRKEKEKESRQSRYNEDVENDWENPKYT